MKEETFSFRLIFLIKKGTKKNKMGNAETKINFIECSEDSVKDNLLEEPIIIYDKKAFEIKGNRIIKKETSI